MGQTCLNSRKSMRMKQKEMDLISRLNRTKRRTMSLILIIQMSWPRRV
jgi:hypothetical protein